MPIKDLNFACVCLKHGIEVHDGSKNECCDEAVIIPMMNEENFESLTEKGQEMFEHDLMRIDELINSGSGIELRESKDFAKWWRGTAVEILMPKLAESKQVPQQDEPEDAEITENDIATSEEELADDGILEHYYMLGYTAGFSAGFERGFDTGHKLSVVKKS